jgi:hypothetical protein
MRGGRGGGFTHDPRLTSPLSIHCQISESDLDSARDEIAAWNLTLCRRIESECFKKETPEPERTLCLVKMVDIGNAELVQLREKHRVAEVIQRILDVLLIRLGGMYNSLFMSDDLACEFDRKVTAIKAALEKVKAPGFRWILEFKNEFPVYKVGTALCSLALAVVCARLVALFH